MALMTASLKVTQCFKKLGNETARSPGPRPRLLSAPRCRLASAASGMDDAATSAVGAWIDLVRTDCTHLPALSCCWHFSLPFSSAPFPSGQSTHHVPCPSTSPQASYVSSGGSRAAHTPFDELADR